MSATEIWVPPTTVEHHHSGPCDCEPTIPYIRVSMVGSREVIIAPEVQLDAIKLDCKQKNKRIVKVVADIDKSGRNFAKRRVNECIGYIKDGVARSISVWKWSRWGRNLQYSLAYLDLVQQAGGRVDSATEDIDASTAIGSFNRDIVMRVDQLYSDMIGESWQAAHAKRREAGLPHTGKKRFGYDYLSREILKTGVRHTGSETCEACTELTPHFVVNEREGAALADLYRDYNNGVGIRKLARGLNDKGLVTPLGGPWTFTAVIQMLETGFGAGWIRERSPELKAKMKGDGKKSVRNTLESFDVWRRGTHEPVIDEKTWDDFRRFREAITRLPPRLRKADHALSALLFCRLCARRLNTKYEGRDRRHAWRCLWKDTFHPDTNVSISDEAAMKIVRLWVFENAKAPSSTEAVDEAVRRELRIAAHSRTVEDIEAELAVEVQALDNLFLQNARGRLSDERFEVLSAVVEGRIAELKTERESVAAASGAVESRPTYEAFTSLDSVWRETALRRPADLNMPLRKLVQFVVVGPAHGVRRRESERVEVVGRWEAETWEPWLRARRRRFSA